MGERTNWLQPLAVYALHSKVQTCTILKTLSQFKSNIIPRAPLTYFNDGGGGVRVTFLGLKFMAQSDFFGSMKDAEIFLGRKKNRGIFGGFEKRTKRFFWVC